MSNDNKHTPGPWKNHGYQVATGVQGGYQMIAETPGSRSYPEHERANGLLIAAAPELLLEAEKDLEMLIELRDKYLSHTAAIVRALVQKRIEATQAAIAKAKGEEP